MMIHKTVLKLIVATIFLSICNNALAQTITGKVVDEDNEPLAFANVVLHKADSTFIAGTVTDTCGLFVISAHPEVSILQVSFVSYRTQFISMKGNDFGVIKMEPDTEMLDKVVVKAVLPKTEIVGDAFVTNVENSVLADAGSANDVLRMLPGVIQKEDGIEVFGKGAPIIYINGRLVRNNSELEILNSSDIKSVDVVHNPGARYDATVKAVIRIKTIKREGDGFGFNLRSTWYQSENTDLYETLNMNYRHKGFDLFGTLSFNQSEYYQDTEIVQSLHSSSPLVLKQDAYFSGKDYGLTTALGFNYQFNENHSIGLQYRPYMDLLTASNNDTYTMATIGGVLDDNTHTLSQGEGDITPTHYVNMYYNGTVGKLNIDFNADFQDSRNVERQKYDELSEMQDNRIVNTVSDTRNRLYASKLILTYPLFGGSLTAGTEYTYTHRDDEYMNAEGYVPDAFTTIQEDNANAFVEYMYPLKFGSISAGVRYEYLSFNYYENDILQEDQSRTYSNFYPNASFNARTGKFQFQLSYAVKTSRPSYRNLTNAIQYIDRYSYTKGNPYLVPEINHDLSFAAVWKFLQFSASYQVEQMKILHWGTAPEDLENIIMLHYTNFGRNIPRVQAMLSASPTIAFWYPRLNVGVQKQWLEIDYLGNAAKLGKPIPFVGFGNTFKIPKGFMATLDYNYTGKGNQYIYELMKPTHQLDISLRKSFLNDALSVELKGVDLFKGRSDIVRMISDIYEIHQKNEFDSREFVLTIRYNFNSARSKYKGTGAGEQQKSRM